MNTKAATVRSFIPGGTAYTPRSPSLQRTDSPVFADTRQIAPYPPEVPGCQLELFRCLQGIGVSLRQARMYRGGRSLTCAVIAIMEE